MHHRTISHHTAVTPSAQHHTTAAASQQDYWHFLLNRICVRVLWRPTAMRVSLSAPPSKCNSTELVRDGESPCHPARRTFSCPSLSKMYSRMRGITPLPSPISAPPPPFSALPTPLPLPLLLEVLALHMPLPLLLPVPSSSGASSSECRWSTSGPDTSQGGGVGGRRATLFSGDRVAIERASYSTVRMNG